MGVGTHRIGLAARVAAGPRSAALGLLVGIASLLLVPAQAPAARRPAPLRPLHGPGACLALDHERGCGPARGFPNPEFAGQVALSPDGHSLYLAALNDSSLGILRVDPVSGRIAQPAGRAGCLAENPSEPREVGCAAVRGLVGSTQGVAVSPDGRTVYVASTSGFPAMGEQGAVAVFARDGSGALTQLPGADGCVSSTALDDCSVQPGLSAENVSVSADGTRVYLGNTTLSTLSRDPSTGALTPLACESVSGARSCSASPFGLSVEAPRWRAAVGYARAFYEGSGSATDEVLALDGSAPSPRPLPGAAGCRGAARLAGCPRDRRLVGYVAGVSPVAGALYVLSGPYSYDLPPPPDTPFAVVGYRLSAAGGLISAHARCLSTTRRRGCTRARAILGGDGIAATRRRLYVNTDAGVVAIGRNTSSGALRVLGAVGGLPEPNVVVPAPSGRFVYVVCSSFNSTGSVRVYATG